MKIYSQLIAALAVVTFFSVSGFAATPATSSAAASPAVSADGVTVTTLAAPTVSAPTTASATPTAVTPTPTPTVVSAPTVAATPAPTVAAAPAPTLSATPAPAAVPTASMQTQPTTVIEAAPLATSDADQLRKLEEQTEVQTEQKIEDQLEKARIASEIKRQKKILKSMDKLTQTAPTKTAASTQPTTPAPVVSSTTTVAPAAASSTTPQEVQEMVKEDLSKIDKPKSAAPATYYLGATLGQINYHLSNVASFGSAFLSLGEKFPTNWNVSADFGYSNNNVNQDVFVYQKMDQYTLGMTARYVFFNGKIQPSLGGALDYVRRQYSGLQDNFGNMYTSYNGGSLGQMTSDAIDTGVVADIDLKISDTFSLGLQYRYMMNLGYKYEGQDILNTAAYRQYVNDYGIGAPLEGRNYDLTSLVIRYLF